MIEERDAFIERILKEDSIPTEDFKRILSIILPKVFLYLVQNYDNADLDNILRTDAGVPPFVNVTVAGIAAMEHVIDLLGRIDMIDSHIASICFDILQYITAKKDIIDVSAVEIGNIGSVISINKEDKDDNEAPEEQEKTVN